MTPEQQKFYDAITKGRRSGLKGSSSVVSADGLLLGPFGVMIREPILGNELQRVGEVLRFSSPFSERLRESIILLVAAHHGSGFEWRVHEGLARAAGLSEKDLALLRKGGIPSLLNQIESEVYLFAQRLLDANSVSDALLGSVLSTEKDSEKIIHASTLVAYYGLLAQFMGLFGVDFQLD